MSEEIQSKIAAILLPGVVTPAQYIGGEINQVHKEYQAGDMRVALAFPDTYAVGMSHLGLSILYTILNRMPGVIAERVFCAWLDAEEIMRRKGIGLFSWESRHPVREFDILGITLQHELAYTNILYLLDLAGIPFRAEHRDEKEPIVIGGGPIADCCEPVADFFDLVILGDGEESLPAVIAAIQELRCRCRRRELLLELARRFPFVYVPQLYHCEYGADGTMLSCEPTEAGVPRCVQRAIVTDLENAIFPTAPIVAHTETVHDRIAIEIMRGCPGRCAFCHAGHTKGPLRYRSVDQIIDLAWQSYLHTGHDTVSLLSLSTSDYPHLAELTQKLYQKFEGRHVGISLPSLRVDRQLRDVPSQVADIRREGLTLAVETASDRMRKAIGKRVTDTDLLATMRSAYEMGWRKVKLYFMVGFPGETREDVLGIVELSDQIARLRREVAGQPASVNVAVSWLVPKPHTPFGWIEQQRLSYFQNARSLLLEAKMRQKGSPLTLKFHHMQRSILEGVFSRGDRRLSQVIEKVYKSGGRFDAWDECFDYNRYIRAFEECGIDPDFYAHRARGETEVLPWDHLAGDNRQQLYQRLQRTLAG